MGYINKNYLQTQFKNFADRLSSVLMAKAEVTEVTQEEYDNLSEEEKAGNTLWAVSDGDGGSGDATAVNYDNTASGLDATNVQDAIDAIMEDVSEVNNSFAQLTTDLNTIHTITSENWDGIISYQKIGHMVVGSGTITLNQEVESYGTIVSGLPTCGASYMSAFITEDGGYNKIYVQEGRIVTREVLPSGYLLRLSFCYISP